MDTKSASLNSPAKRLRWRILIPFAILILSLGLIPIARVIAITYRLANNAQTAQNLAQGGMAELIQSERLEQLGQMIEESTQDVRELRALLGALIDAAPWFGWLPIISGDLENLPALMNFAERLLVTAEDTLAIGSSLNVELEAGRASGTPITASLLRTTQSQSAEIQDARRRLAETRQSRSRISAARLSPSARAPLNRIDQSLPMWQTTLDALAIAPILLGGDRPRVYLLLAQNNDELRATGGFISGAALLRVDRGMIAVSDFQDSYAVDDLTKLHPTPPRALTQYMFTGVWLLRDSNWSPDFPTAALVAENIYSIDRGIIVDGVIAVNDRMIPRLLDATGAVTLETYPERIDSQNDLAVMRAYWASPQGQGQSGDWWRHRKDFSGKLLEAIVSRLRTGEFDRTKLARALFDSILAKDLLVYVNDAGVENNALAWGGALYKGTGDALMIVDSNVGFNKVDGNIERRAEYFVSLDASGAGQAVLSLTYTNLSAATDDATCLHRPYYPPTYAELQQGCYWNYVRVVVPEGSQLISTTEGLEAATEPSTDGRTVFGAFFVVPCGESRTIRFEYRLPVVTPDKVKYNLKLEKQPGAAPFQIRVRVALPEGWRLHSAEPEPSNISDKTIAFSILLDRDQEIALLSDSSQPISSLALVSALVVVLLLIGVGLYRRRRG